MSGEMELAELLTGEDNFNEAIARLSENGDFRGAANLYLYRAIALGNPSDWRFAAEIFREKLADERFEYFCLVNIKGKRTKASGEIGEFLKTSCDRAVEKHWWKAVETALEVIYETESAESLADFVGKIIAAGDRDGALANDATELLCRFFAERPASLKILSSLAPYLLRVGALPELAKILKAADKKEGDKEALADYFIDLGLKASKLAFDPALAVENLEKGLEYKPQSKIAEKTLSEFKSALEDSLGAAQRLVESAREEESEARAAELYLTAGSLFYIAGEPTGESWRCLQRSLILDSRSPEAFHLGKRLFECGEDSAKLSRLFLRIAKISAEDGEHRLPLLSLLSCTLKNRADAEAIASDVVALVGGDERLSAPLADWVSRIGDSETRVKLFDTTAINLSKIERDRWTFKAALTYEDELNQREKAEPLYKKLAASSPLFLEALLRSLTAAKKRGTKPDFEEIKPEFYIPLLETKSDWERFWDKLGNFDNVPYNRLAIIAAEKIRENPALLEPKVLDFLLDGLKKENATTAFVVEKLLTAARTLPDVPDFRWRRRLLNHLNKLEIFPQAAAELLNIALEKTPDDEKLKALKTSLMRSRGEWEALLNEYHAELAKAQDEGKKRDIRLKIGETLFKLGRFDEAYETYSELLDADSSDNPAAEGLAMLLSAAPENSRQIVARLMDYYKKRGDWHSYIAAIQEALELLDDPEEIYKLIKEASAISLDKLAQPQTAIQMLLKGVRTIPKKISNELPEIASLARTHHQLKPLLSAAESALPSLEGEVKISYLRLIADITLNDLAEPLKASQIYEQLLALQPNDKRIIEKIETIYEKQGERLKLIPILEKKLVTLDEPQEKAQSLFRLAKLNMEKPDFIGAFENLKEALRLDDGKKEYWALALNLAERLERWDEATSYLELFAAKKFSSQESALAAIRAALIYIEIFNAPQKALDVIKSLLADGAASSELVYILTRLAEKELTAKPALESLAALYRKQEKWQALAEALKRLSPLTNDEGRAAVDMEIIETLDEKLSQKPAAFAYACEAFRLAPENPDIRKRLEDLALNTGMEEAVGELYAELLAGKTVIGDETKKTLATRAADIKASLHEHSEAVAHLEEALKINPDDPELKSRMEQLLRAIGDFRKLSEMLEEKLSALDVDERPPILIELSEIYEQRLGDNARAAEALNELSLLKPNEPEYLIRLERLYDIARNRAEQINAIKRLSDIAEGADERDKLRLKQARLLMEMGEMADAAGILISLLENESHRIEAAEWLKETLADTEGAAVSVKPLVALMEAEKEWEEAAFVIHEALPKISDLSLKLELYEKLWNILENRLDDKPAAFEVVKEAYLIPKADDKFREKLERLAVETENRKALIPTFKKKTESINENPEELAAVFVRLAELYGSVENDKVNQMEFYRKALEAKSDHRGAITALARLYEESERWEDLLDILRKRLAVTGEEEGQAAVYYRIAEVYQEELAEPSEAAAALRKAIELKPDYEEAYSMLSEALTMLKRWAELKEVLKNWLKTASSEYRKGALIQLFRVLWLNLEAWDEAKELFESLSEDDEAYADAVGLISEFAKRSESGDARLKACDILITIHTRAKDYDKLIEIYSIKKEFAEERFEATLKIAEIQRDKLNAPDKAFLTLSSILEEEIGNSEYLDALVEFSRSADMLDELADILVEQAEDAGERGINALLKAALLMDKELDNQDSAINIYEKALRLSPSNLKALDELDRFYRLRSEWDELANILSKKIKIEEDAKERADLYFRRARLFEQSLDSVEDAKSDYLASLELDPENRPALHSLARIAEENGDFETLASVLNRLIPLIDDENELQKVKRHLAEILEEHLSRPEEALSLWLELETSAPDIAEESFAAICRLYRKCGKFEDAVKYLRAKLDDIQSASQERLARLELAGILFENLDDPTAAREQIEAVLEKNPKFSPALTLAAKIYSKLELWDKQSEILNSLEKLMTEEKQEQARKELLISQSKLLFKELNRNEEALMKAAAAFDIEPHTEAELAEFRELFIKAERYDKALTAMFAHSEMVEDEAERIERFLEVAALAEDKAPELDFARRAYEEILEIEVDHELARERLEKIYEQKKLWAELANLLLARIVLTPVKEEKIKLLLRIAEIQSEKLDQNQKAFLTLARGLELDILNDELNAAIENIAKKSESAEELADLWEEGLEELRENADAATLRLRFARLCHEYLSESERAVQHLINLLNFASGNDDAHSLLVSIYDKLENYNELAEELNRRLLVPGLEDDERRSLLARLADIYAEKLDDRNEAIKTLEKLLDEFPEDAKAVAKLSELARERGDAGYMLRVLDRSLRVAETDEDKIELYLKRAEIYENDLGEENRAIEEYERVCQLNAANHRALNALDKIFTRREDYENLVDIVERKISAVTKENKRVALLKRLAAINEEHRENIPDALVALERAEAISPEDIAIKHELARLYRLEKMGQKLIPVLQFISEKGTGREERIKALEELGEIFLLKSDYDHAEKSLKSLIELDEENLDAWKNIAVAYEKSYQWILAFDAYRRVSALAKESAEKSSALIAAGFIANEYLQNKNEAVDCYKKALEISDGNLKAITALKEIYFNSEEWDNYLKYYSLEAEAVEDPAEKAKILAAIGKFYQSHLNDLEKAVPFYESALEKKPDFLAAAKPLADYYFAKKDWKRAQSPLETLVGNLNSEENKKEFVKEAYRLAYVCEQLGDSESALKWYRESFKLDSTYFPTLEAFARALLKADKRQEAIRVHQAILLHHREELDELEIVDIFNRLGVLFMKEGENDKALKSFLRAYEINELDIPTLENLIEVHSRREDWEAVYDFSEKYAGLLVDEKQANAYLKLARFCRDKLEDNFRAISAIENALESDGENIEAMELAVRLYVATQQGKKAVEIIERLSARDIGDRKKVIYHLTAGQILQNLRERDKALEHFEKTLAIEPGNVKAFAAIEELLAEKKDWNRLASAYEKMLAATPEGDKDRSKILLQNLAELYRRMLNDTPAAIKTYETLLELAPDNTDMVSTLSDLYIKAGEREKAIRMHQRLVKISSTPIKSYRTLRRLYTETKQVDAIFNVCAVLKYINQAEPDDTRFYQAALKKAPQTGERALTDVLWDDYLITDEAKAPFGNILGILWRRIPEIFGSSSGYQVDKEAFVDTSTSMAFLVNMFKYAARTLNIGEPSLYKPATLGDGVKVGTVGRDPIIAVGANLFKSMEKRDILFALATAISYTKPEFILAATNSRDTIEVILTAAISSVETGYGAKGDPRQIEMWRKKIVKALPPDAATELRKYATAIARGNFDLDTWLEGAQFTAFRAGLLLSTDIETTMNGIEHYGGEIVRVQKRKALREMLMFAVSNEYFNLRKKLVLDIKGREG